MANKQKQNKSSKKAGVQKTSAISQRQVEYRKHIARWESIQEEKRRLKHEAHNNGKMECHKKFDKFKNPTGEK